MEEAAALISAARPELAACVEQTGGWGFCLQLSTKDQPGPWRFGVVNDTRGGDADLGRVTIPTDLPSDCEDPRAVADAILKGVVKHEAEVAVEEAFWACDSERFTAAYECAVGLGIEYGEEDAAWSRS